MITKSTLITIVGKPWILEFPELETIHFGDPEVQAALKKWGLAVSAPSGGIVITHDVKLVALKGGDNHGQEQDSS